MTHTEKLEAMKRHMAALGILPSTAAPPAWRLLWRFGVEIPPPIFLGFWRAALYMGAIFGVLWGALMWLLLWAWWGMPLSFILVSALAAGVLFGLLMATYYRYLARKHNLPSWAEYTGQ